MLEAGAQRALTKARFVLRATIRAKLGLAVARSVPQVVTAAMQVLSIRQLAEQAVVVVQAQQ
jgi:hypothetical protein